MSTGNQEQKEKARKSILAELQKSYGKGSVGVYKDMEQIDVETVSTGSLNLDAALGGGLARGRVVEIYGPEASGKTTLTLHCMAEVQKQGGYAAFIDAEHALDVEYASNLGVNVDDLVLSQPDYGEQALNIVQKLVESGAFDVIVVDSVAALVPKAEIDGEMGQVQPGLQARMISQATRKLAGLVSKTKTILIFVNQIRQKIGVMFGSPETTSGGKALKYYSTQRIDIRRIGTIKAGDEITGCRTKCKIEKNKVAPPYRICEFDIRFGQGINKAGEILDSAVQLHLIEKNGAWYSTTEGERVGQGRDNACEYLRNNPQFTQKLEMNIRKEFGLND